VRRLRELRDRIAGDGAMLAFHEGRSQSLPGFYGRMLRQRLGRYGELLADGDLTPELEPPAGLLGLGSGLVGLGSGRAMPLPA
ncbi:MAG TPA: hypothetical protein VFS60_18170, partial [Thermoanaerobaculia bacterium]|nr:hypothetical protein [Thermoanaerobaculia bacterium]